MASEPVKIISFVSLIYLFPTVFTAFLRFHISWARTQIRNIHEYIIYDPLIYISYQGLSSQNLITTSTLHQYSFNRIFFRLNSLLDVTPVAVYNLPLRRCMRSWSHPASEAKQFVKELYIVPKLCSLTCATHTSREMLQRCVLLFWTLLLLKLPLIMTSSFFFLSLGCDVPALEARRSFKLPRRIHITYNTIYLDTKSTLRTELHLAKLAFSYLHSHTAFHLLSFSHTDLHSYTFTYIRMFVWNYVNP